MSWEVIERRFREAGVPVRRREAFWFRADVDREGPREWIRLALADAEVQVIDTDPGHRQVLLLVHEPNRAPRMRAQKILCGRDEQHLFVVGVPNPAGVAVNSVAAAHRALKPPELQEAERRNRKVVRQGEWFFEPWPQVTWELSAVRRRVRLGGRNPHIVDHLSGDTRQFFVGAWWGDRNFAPVLARGFVRHRDHRPLNLRCWHRVLRNTGIPLSGDYQD